MANPTPLTHTNTYGRRTLEDILDRVAYMIGLEEGDFTAGSVDRAILIDIINEEIDEARIEAPVERFGWGFNKDYEWAGGGGDDPASGDTQLELPDDLGEFQSGGILYEISTDDPQVTAPVHIISEEAFNSAFRDGESPWDQITGHIAIRRGLSTNKKKILEIYPAPDDGFKLRVPYHAHVEELINVADELEAPRKVAKLIMLKSAIGWMIQTGRGSQQQLDNLRAERNRAIKSLRSPEARETKRQRRVRAFGVDHGYEVFEPPVGAGWPFLRARRSDA